MRDKVAFLMGDVPARVSGCKAVAHACDPVGRSESAELELARCVARLRDADLEPVAIDVTPRDIRDTGFVVVRVVVADLHPLWGGHHVRCLGGRRVREVPVRLGYFDHPRALTELNADPHPMP
jgi:ribosomal protein S12 methylthiotransferase accessory factor